MNKFEQTVPGACWVEILSVRDKDGFPSDRYFLEGCASVFFITGGLEERWAFFRGKVRLEQGEPTKVVANVYLMTRLDGTTLQINEIAPDVFEFEVQNTIYQLRLLNEAESAVASEAVSAMYEEDSKEGNA